MIASDFNKHVKPVAVVPEPENEPDTDSVGDLIDTSDVSIFVSYCYRDVQLIKIEQQSNEHSMVPFNIFEEGYGPLNLSWHLRSPICL